MVNYPEVEGPIKAYLKAQPGIVAATGDAKYVFFEAPDSPDRPQAWLTFHRLGGAPQLGDVPEDSAYMTFSCWGRTRVLAAGLRTALVEVLMDLKRTQPAMGDGSLICKTARIVLDRWQPDQNGTPAYVVDAYLTFLIKQVA